MIRYFRSLVLSGILFACVTYGIGYAWEVMFDTKESKVEVGDKIEIFARRLAGKCVLAKVAGSKTRAVVLEVNKDSLLVKVISSSNLRSDCTSGNILSIPMLYVIDPTQK